MSKNQAPHHSPDEPKARALVLAMEGHPAEAIGPLVGVSGRTVQRWVARCREVSRNQETPEMLDDWVRIVRRSQGMQHAVLDVVEQYAEIATNDHPGPLAEIARVVARKEVLKQAVTYNIYAGTGTDKLQKESQASQPPAHAGPLVIIVGVEKPEPVLTDVIEGELVEGGVPTPPIPESVIPPTHTHTKGRRPGPASPDRAG